MKFEAIILYVCVSYKLVKATALTDLHCPACPLRAICPSYLVFVFINSREAIDAVIGDIVFFTIQWIWIVLGRCLFFKICSHIFMILE